VQQDAKRENPGEDLNIQPSIMVVMVPTIRKNSTKNWAAAEHSRLPGFPRQRNRIKEKKLIGGQQK
jgi:hypothetical protein